MAADSAPEEVLRASASGVLGGLEAGEVENATEAATELGRGMGEGGGGKSECASALTSTFADNGSPANAGGGGGGDGDDTVEAVTLLPELAPTALGEE